MNYRKMVTDSSSDMLSMCNIPLEVAPLKIITANKEYVDNASLDVHGMVEDLQNYKGRSSTSCPNVEDWLSTFGDAREVFCVTITGTLSGSYNAALIAAQTYEEQYPDRRVFVCNSLSTGPEIALLLDKLKELLSEELPFDEICRRVTAYSQKTRLLFMLESMKNLANNGRVSPLVAKAAGLLGIRLVGKASDKGDLEPLTKCRGEAKALDTIVQYIRDMGPVTGTVRIAHCENETAANALKARLQAAFSDIKVLVYSCRGLCSFYAEKGGLLIGFERA